MFIGKMDGQTSGINIQAINRSAAQKAGKSPEEAASRAGQNDTLSLSPAGKKQSLIDQLMKQKEFLEERKQSFMDQASENGSPSMEQLKEFEKQLKNIDEQIAQLQSEQMSETEETEEDKEGIIYEKPKTKEEAETQQIAQLTSMASNMEQAEVISSVKDQVDGRTRVLKAEIKSGNGNIESKIEEAAKLTSQSQQLTADMAEKVQETNASMAEAEPVKAEEANASMAQTAPVKAEEASEAQKEEGSLSANAQAAGEETEEEES